LVRVMSITLRELLAALWRTVVASSMMAAILHVLFGLPSDNVALHPLATLIASAITGGVTYVGATALLWWLSGRPPGAESWAVQRFRDAIAPLMRRWRPLR
jgi:hypothetical protein